MNDRSQAEPAEAPSAGRSVVMLSGDLMFASRVKAAAAHAGMDFQISGQLPATDAASIRYVILDLSTRSALVADIAARCADQCPQAQLIAYGPHVKVDKLDAARQAGVDTVMTNGQFDRALPQLFA